VLGPDEAAAVAAEFGAAEEQIRRDHLLSQLRAALSREQPRRVDRVPNPMAWSAQLGAQTRLAVDPQQALGVVAAAWASALH
jgi:hypothetical protein